MMPTKSPPRAVLIRARHLLWRAAENIIEDGVVVVRGNRIEAVGKYRDILRSNCALVIDLGDAVILPALVNAHCHLNYTNLAGAIKPVSSFTKWLQTITALKRDSTPSDFREAKKEGLHQLIESGAGTVADIVSDANSVTSKTIHQEHFQIVRQTSLRVWSFFELLDLGRPVCPKRYLQDVTSVASVMHCSRGGLGLSPHSPYIVSAPLMRAAGEWARRHRCLITIHIAESNEEFEMFAHRRGELFEAVAKWGAHLSTLGNTTPVQWLARLGVLNSRCIGVHLNYLTEEDIEIVARSKMSVVHCPQSHAYFGHCAFPVGKLLMRGVNVCLGTDSSASLSSNNPRQRPKLNLLTEMRVMLRNNPHLRPALLLEMATLNGARALKCPDKIGSIEPRKFADLIAIPCAAPSKQVIESILDSEEQPFWSMIHGQIVMDFTRQ